jgi:hypothetical protein
VWVEYLQYSCLLSVCAIEYQHPDPEIYLMRIRIRHTVLKNQCCGSVLIFSGSGSRVCRWRPIRIQGFNDQKLKKNTAEKKVKNYYNHSKKKPILRFFIFVSRNSRKRRRSLQAADLQGTVIDEIMYRYQNQARYNLRSWSRGSGTLADRCYSGGLVHTVLEQVKKYEK